MIATALSYGALWGIAEATIGYLLHLSARLVPLPGIAGFIMFPVAFYCMYRVFMQTGSPGAVLLTAVIAAATKALSALHPVIVPLFVINPSIALLMEGLAVAAAALLLPRALTKPRSLEQAAVILSTAIGWRLLFLSAVLLLPVQKGILMKGPAALSSFLLVEGIFSAVLCFGLLSLSAAPKRASNRSWRTALLLFPLAVALQIASGLG